jgi:hypothetical protein
MIHPTAHSANQYRSPSNDHHARRLRNPIRRFKVRTGPHRREKEKKTSIWWRHSWRDNQGGHVYYSCRSLDLIRGTRSIQLGTQALSVGSYRSVDDAAQGVFHTTLNIVRQEREVEDYVRNPIYCHIYCHVYVVVHGCLISLRASVAHTLTVARSTVM